MKLLTKACILFLLVLISGCGASIAITGNAQDPIPTGNVKVYFNKDPECSYDDVGLLEDSGNAYSMDGLFSNFKKKAASVGADGVIISQIDKHPLGVYRGTATAIRCNN